MLSVALLVPILAIPQTGMLLVRSTSRPVKVELRDGETWKRCTTPCRLSLAPGSYSARVDGLDRRFTVEAGENRYEVEPTRRAQQIVGIVAVALGGTGLTLAGQPIPRLGMKTRLGLAGAGLLLMGVAVPLIRGSSATVQRGGGEALRHTPTGSRARVELDAGAEYILGSNLPEPDLSWRLAFAGGYFVTDHVSLGVKGRMGGATGLDRGYALLGRAAAEVRVPLVHLFASLGAGYGAEELPAGLEDERTDEDRGFVMELQGGLRLRLWRGLGIEASATYQAATSRAHASGWSHTVLAGGGLSLRL